MVILKNGRERMSLQNVMVVLDGSEMHDLITAKGFPFETATHEFLEIMKYTGNDIVEDVYYLLSADGQKVAVEASNLKRHRTIHVVPGSVDSEMHRGISALYVKAT